MIDTTAPFFIRHKKEFVNWSKVPHHELEREGKVKKKVHRKIRQSFREFIQKISEIGYNAITIDELCYMVPRDNYPESLNRKIHKYIKYYKKLFFIAAEKNLRIFVTTDVMFFHRDDRAGTRDHLDSLSVLLEELPRFFERFPEVEGIIFRIGESDGVDVRGDFRSEIVLKTPEQANRFISELLPVFEKYNKLFIFRTWSIGAYSIGDLIWNSSTYEKVFQGIDSPSFFISLKYGETDFFRFQKLSPFFFKDNIPKILELQARREYEGFGEFPNFPAIDYEEYRDQLVGNGNLAGIQVWSQTGGWSRFKNYTFLKKTSLWNEINTFVTLRLYRNRETIRESLEAFIQYRGLEIGPDQLLEFLSIADQAVKKILYDPVYGSRSLYMNRTRIPSLIHVTWDQVTISEGIAGLYKIFGSEENRILEESTGALKNIKKMKEIARDGNLEYSHRFHYETFQLFYLARLAMVRRDRTEVLEKLEKKVRKYTKRYPNSYCVKVSLGESGKRFSLLHFLFRIVIRQGQKYRRIERILFNPLMASVYMFFFYRYRNRFPAFLDKQAMPIRYFLK